MLCTAVMSVNTDINGRFRISGVPPGKYYLVALDQTVLDTEFGPVEWFQVRRWARPIEVGESTQLTVELEPARVRNDSVCCGSLAILFSQLPQRRHGPWMGLN